MEHYDGTKLLSQKDKNGNAPALYITSSNRSSGKTTYFTHLLFEHYKETKQPFAMFWRYMSELDGAADKIFADQKRLYYPSDTLQGKRNKREPFVSLYLNDEKTACGYVFAINGSDRVRKFSARFSGVSEIFFDEFQSETEDYCPNEIRKFQSLYNTIARGSNGTRHVPVYMASNCVSVLNPYYTALGVAENWRAGQRYQRGAGWVAEIWWNETAAESMKKSAMGRAFSGSEYYKFAADNTYLLDPAKNIARAQCKTSYILTLIDEDKEYGVRYGEDGYYYIDERPDPSALRRIAVDRHTVGTNGARYESVANWHYRKAFDAGCFRYSSQSARAVCFKWLGMR